MIALPWGQNRRYSYVQYWTSFQEGSAFQGCTCAPARCTPPPPSFAIELHSWNFIGVPISTSVAQSIPNQRTPSVHVRCTCICPTSPKVVHHRIALVKLRRCTKFGVAITKFPENRGAYVCAKCTCIARALCTITSNGMHHRNTLIELSQCTKFGVGSSKFLKTERPLPNKLFRSYGARSPTTQEQWPQRHTR